MTTHTSETAQNSLTLVTGGTGKTGRRIVEQLVNLGVPTRSVSRHTELAFDWNTPKDWSEILHGVTTVYISYSPDLAIPGATDTIHAFVTAAVENGVSRLVLLSGRGEAEAEICEQIVQESGLQWTIVRASWFFQNFSEGEFSEFVCAGELPLPAGATLEPFVDVEDIVEVAVAALTEDGHHGEVYELTGPRLLSFADVAAELSCATGRQIRYKPISADEFQAGLQQTGAPADITWLMGYLFSTVLDGRNASLHDGVQRATGHPPRDFSDYAQRIAATGQWHATVPAAEPVF